MQAITIKNYENDGNNDRFKKEKSEETHDGGAESQKCLYRSAKQEYGSLQGASGRSLGKRSDAIVMRYLIDTNIYIYLATDQDSLSQDVFDFLNEPDAILCVSAETVRELIVAYRNKGWGNRRWKNTEDMVRSIEEDYFVEILPLQKEVMRTYSRLRINTAMNHKDPSDHVIIAHAMTLGIPLVSSDTRFPFYQKQGLQLLFNEK